MKIDISDIKNKKNANFEFSGDLKIDFKDEIIEFSQPVKVKLNITNTGENILVEGEAKVVINALCSRCLKNFEYNLDAKIKEEFYSHIDEKLFSILKENCREGNLYYDNSLEIDKVIKENLLLELPIKMLCKKSCQGLCPKCGKNLNYEKCKCEISEIDTRWESLKNFKGV